MLAARAIPHQKALPAQEIPRLQSKGRKTRGHGSRSWILKLGMLEAGEGQWDSRALHETAVVQAQGHFGIERKMSICSIKWGKTFCEHNLHSASQCTGQLLMNQINRSLKSGTSKNSFFVNLELLATEGRGMKYILSCHFLATVIRTD